jgi:hypothetical protein
MPGFVLTSGGRSRLGIGFSIMADGRILGSFPSKMGAAKYIAIMTNNIRGPK